MGHPDDEEDAKDPSSARFYCTANVVMLILLGLVLYAVFGCAAPLERPEPSQLVWVRTQQAKGPMIGTGSVIRPGEKLEVAGSRALPGDVVTVDHVAPGARVTVITHRGPFKARVVWRHRGWVCLRAVDPKAGIVPGDSGSPVVDSHNRVVGLVEGGRVGRGWKR